MRLASQAIAVLACGLTLSTAAHAQTESKWYAAFGGSLSLREDTTGTIANAPTPGSTVRTENSFEPGFGGQVAVGRSLGPFRLEGELGYSRETQDSYFAVVPATGYIPANVEEETTRAMINGYWDAGTGPIAPYLGIGLGYASTDLLFVAPRAILPTEQPRALINESDEGFAYQLMAGIAAPINERVGLTVQYRWFDAGDFEGVDARGQAITREHAGHNIDVGMRVQF